MENEIELKTTLDSKDDLETAQQLEVSQLKPETLLKIKNLKERYFMYRNFIDGLISGVFVPLTEEQIEKIVQENFFSFKPLLPLDQTQEVLLRQYLVEELHSLNREIFGQLCKPVYEISKIGNFSGAGLVVGDITKYKKNYPQEKPIRLSLEDKFRKLFDPNFWNYTNYGDSCGGSMPLKLQGNRTLKECGFKDAEWLNLTESVRRLTGKDKLTVLDIGCGVGLALRDMKNLDPNIETHGITIEQEPAMCDGVDAFHYVAGERMPSEVHNKFDIITSFTSFRYHLFPNISFRNAVMALSKGGHAGIVLDYDRFPDREPYLSYYRSLVPEAENDFLACRALLERDFEMYRKLEARGLLKIKASEDFKKYYRGWVEIDKLKETTAEDFL